MDEREIARRIDRLTYVVEEISDANLKAGEEEALKEERELLGNAELRANLADHAYRALYGEGEDSKGAIVSQAIKNKGFLALGKHVGGFYYIAIAWVIMCIIAWFVLTRTRYGLHVYAMGSNAKSSEMSGINVNRMKISTFTICGACCAVGAVLVVAYQQTAYLSLGSAMGFNAVAACVVGGVILGGGRGDTIGALLGAIFMTLVNNGMYKYGLDTSWQYVFQGAVILIAIMTDAGVGVLTARKLRAQANASAKAEKSIEGGTVA
jgi:ribose transport system permease protein